MAIPYASAPDAPVPVTIISGVRVASSIPSVQCSAAPSFALATVSFGSAAAAGAEAISVSAAASTRVRAGSIRRTFSCGNAGVHRGALRCAP